MRFVRTSMICALLLIGLPACSDDDGPAAPNVVPPLPGADEGEIFLMDDANDVFGSPDFKELQVNVTDYWVRFQVTSWADLMGDGRVQSLYMYNTNREVVVYWEDSFLVRRDSGADGHFETFLTSGSPTSATKNEIVWYVQRHFFPDLDGKGIWSYSAATKDRIPDAGRFVIHPSGD